MSADFLDLEPGDPFEALVGLRDRCLDGILDAFLRDPDDFDFLVNPVFSVMHSVLLGRIESFSIVTPPARL